MKNSKKIYFYSVLMVFFILLILLSNWKNLHYHCVNANDFSIYQQAIYDIAAGDNWNPYITIRNVKIFGDHFDPIIILAAGFVKLFGYSSYNLVLFEWLWFVTLMIFAFRKLKATRNFPLALLGCTFLIFNRSLLQGLEFPIHPATWSMLPSFLLFYYIRKDNYWGVILTSVSLLLFREIFPFMILGLSFFYFFNRKWKSAIPLFFSALVALFVIFYIRPRYWGPTINYGGSLLKDLIHGHIFYFWHMLSTGRYPWNIFGPHLLLISLIVWAEFKRDKTFLSHSLVAWIFFASPMIILHIIAQRFEHHHTILITASLISVFVFSSVFEKIRSKKIWIVVVLSFVLTSSSRYTRMFNMLFLNKTRNCEVSKEKRVSVEKVYKIVNNINKDIPILVSGGLVPDIMRPLQNIHQICDTSKIIPSWDYLIFEKYHHGDLNPIVEADVRRIINDCKQSVTSVLYDDQYYYIAKGHFTDECIGMKKKWPQRTIYLPSETK